MLEVFPMTATMTMNAQARKSLSSQIDRLDGILDGLADALNESVAATVRQTVGEAVTVAAQAAVVEVLTNPTLHQRLHASSARRWSVGAAVVPVARLAKRCWSGLLRAAKAAWHRTMTAARTLAVRTVSDLTNSRGAASARCRAASAWVGSSVRRWW